MGLRPHNNCVSFKVFPLGYSPPSVPMNSKYMYPSKAEANSPNEPPWPHPGLGNVDEGLKLLLMHAISLPRHR